MECRVDKLSGNVLKGATALSTIDDSSEIQNLRNISGMIGLPMGFGGYGGIFVILHCEFGGAEDRISIGIDSK